MAESFPTFLLSGIRLTGIAVATPAHIERNDTGLTWLSSKEKKALTKHIGIEQRRIAKTETVSALGASAAQTLMRQIHQLHTDDIGLLMLVTQTGEARIPGTVYALHDQLGLNKQCICIEVNWACAGYVYGLWSAGVWLKQTKGLHALLVAGDCSSRCLAHQDSATVPIFSDAVSATMLTKMPHHHKTNPPWQFMLQNDGSQRHSIYMGDAPHERLKMNGLSVLEWTLGPVAKGIKALMAREQRKIDHYVFHQASQLINQTLCRRLGIDASLCASSLQSWGNTSSASIPLTMLVALSQELKHGQKHLLLGGFGAGLAWGCATLSVENLIMPRIETLDTSRKQTHHAPVSKQARPACLSSPTEIAK